MRQLLSLFLAVSFIGTNVPVYAEEARIIPVAEKVAAGFATAQSESRQQTAQNWIDSKNAGLTVAIGPFLEDNEPLDIEHYGFPLKITGETGVIRNECASNDCDMDGKKSDDDLDSRVLFLGPPIKSDEGDGLLKKDDKLADLQLSWQNRISVAQSTPMNESSEAKPLETGILGGSFVAASRPKDSDGGDVVKPGPDSHRAIATLPEEQEESDNERHLRSFMPEKKAEERNPRYIVSINGDGADLSLSNGRLYSWNVADNKVTITQPNGQTRNISTDSKAFFGILNNMAAHIADRENKENLWKAVMRWNPNLKKHVRRLVQLAACEPSESVKHPRTQTGTVEQPTHHPSPEHPRTQLPDQVVEPNNAPHPRTFVPDNVIVPNTAPHPRTQTGTIDPPTYHPSPEHPRTQVPDQVAPSPSESHPRTQTPDGTLPDVNLPDLGSHPRHTEPNEDSDEPDTNDSAPGRGDEPVTDPGTTPPTEPRTSPVPEPDLPVEPDTRPNTNPTEPPATSWKVLSPGTDQSWSDGSGFAVWANGPFNLSGATKLKFNFPADQAGVKFLLRITKDDNTEEIFPTIYKVPDGGGDVIIDLPRAKFATVSQISIHSGTIAWETPLNAALEGGVAWFSTLSVEE